MRINKKDVGDIHLRKVIATACSMGLITGVLITGPISSATADTFNPANDTPTITSVTSTLAIQPDSGVGDTVYTIDATVGDANSLQDLVSVGLTIYRITGGDATGATGNPQNTALITWTQVDNTFNLDASSGAESSNWALGNSTPADSAVSSVTAGDAFSAYSATALSMAMRFTFRVSDVAQEATDWAIRVVATDGEATATHDDTTGFSIGYYGRVSTQRSGQALGTPSTGGTVDANNVTAGTFVTNGGSDIQLSVSTFTDGNSTISHADATTVAGAVGNRKFALEAVGGITYATVDAVRLSATLADVSLAQFTSGTAEAGDATKVQSFRLYNGGGLPRLGSAYSATVTVGITADA